MTYHAVAKLVRKLARKDGINKRFNPHSFRYARKTHLSVYFIKTLMKKYFG